MSNDNSGKGAITPFRLTAAVAERKIRALAIDSANIQWTNHALERLHERGVADVEVLRTLRSGSIIGVPELTDREDWKCKMIKRMEGGRDLGVVTIILRSEKLLLKTVEWEDIR